MKTYNEFINETISGYDKNKLHDLCVGVLSNLNKYWGDPDIIKMELKNKKITFTISAIPDYNIFECVNCIMLFVLPNGFNPNAFICFETASFSKDDDIDKLEVIKDKNVCELCDTLYSELTKNYKISGAMILKLMC